MTVARFTAVASRKFSTLRAGGWPLFRLKAAQHLRRLRSMVVWLVHSWWTLPAVLLIRLLQPVVLIRTGALYGAKVGHFVMDAATYYAEFCQRKSRKKVIELFWIDGRISNQAWLRILKRYLRIYWWVKYVDQTNRLLPLGMRTKRSRHINNNSRDINGALAQTDSVFELTEEERNEGIRWLRRKGWAGEKFVCLHVRDELFHDSLRHSFRDSSIETYGKSIELLLSLGFWVIRTGRRASTRVPIQSGRIIDYPFCPDQADLMDVFFFANSALTITTGSGPDAIAAVFRVPMLFVNLLPLSFVSSFLYSLAVPKHLIWKSTGKHLSIWEYMRNRDLYSEHYERSGIEIIDLGEDEILHAVEETLEYIDVNSRDPLAVTDQSIQLQALLKQTPEIADLHSWVHPKAGIARSFMAHLESLPGPAR